MQNDFCMEGGYISQAGVDTSRVDEVVVATKRVLDCVREVGAKVIFTTLCFRADLADAPKIRLWRSEEMGVGIGTEGPRGRYLVRGESGAEIVSALQPLEGEVVVEKPGLGAFYATGLDAILRNSGIRNLIFAGVTTDVCVHATMLEANDRGYECLLMTDCTRAAKDSNYGAITEIVGMQHGLVGTLSASDAVIKGMRSAQMAS